MQERGFDYVAHLDEHYRSYHNHKEVMAYSGMALYVAAFGTALVSKEWPPSWALRDPLLAFWAVTAAWILFLLFIKWQLSRRRWAALRAGGTDRLLARWTTSPPTQQDLGTWEKQAWEPPSLWDKAIDHFWPIAAAVSVVKLNEEVYPASLVSAWIDQAKDHGTDAIVHERLMIVMGWCLYTALAIRTAIT